MIKRMNGMKSMNEIKSIESSVLVQSYRYAIIIYYNMKLFSKNGVELNFSSPANSNEKFSTGEFRPTRIMRARSIHKKKLIIAISRALFLAPVVRRVILHASVVLNGRNKNSFVSRSEKRTYHQ
jgi:hypothetical protein